MISLLVAFSSQLAGCILLSMTSFLTLVLLCSLWLLDDSSGLLAG